MTDGEAVSNLDAHLGYWMRMVSNAVSQSFARKIEAEGVTVAEWAFMRVLYDFSTLPPTALAERMGMTKGAITKLADRLIAKRLVTRRANPDDKRAQTLGLSTKGRALIPKLARLADENDAAFFGVLAAKDRAALEKILMTITQRHALDGVPTD